MQRNAFLAALVASVGASQLTHVTAALALDEAAIGREYFSQLRDQGEILFDSPYYEHLNEVGRIVAEAARSRYPYPIRFYIVKGESANAFSVPGGNIYVNEPLLRLAKNRDELGGVLAHETGHMVLHHVARRMSQSGKAGMAAQIGSILAQILVGPILGMGADYALSNLYGGVDANISRHIESEADEEGARIAAATGELNPYGLIWFFQIMSATYGRGQKSWIDSHPLDDTRIAGLKRLFAANPQTFGKFHDTEQRDVAYW